MVIAALGWFGWLATAIMLLAAAASSADAVRERSGGPAVASAVFTGGAALMLAALGVLAVGVAVFATVVSAATTVVVTLMRKETLGDVLGHIAEGLGSAVWWTRKILAYFHLQLPSFRSRVRDGAGASTPSPGHRFAIPVRRDVPPLRDDPALGEPPVPEDVASAVTSVPVPAPWAAVAAYIAGFEADKEADEIRFWAGNAAGLLACSQASDVHGDHLLNGVGVDPAIVAGVVEFSGVLADTSADAAMVIRRMRAVYQELRDAIAAGLQLPHQARKWFGDGEAA